MEPRFNCGILNIRNQKIQGPLAFPNIIVGTFVENLKRFVNLLI